jgi:hypothetical protein
MLINDILIRNGKVIGAYSIGFLFGYLAYKVCIVFALDSDTKITAINARRTVHDCLRTVNSYLPSRQYFASQQQHLWQTGFRLVQREKYFPLQLSGLL